MEIDEMEIIPMELKYCERCGSLWMRPCGDANPYCPACAPWMADLPRRDFTFAGREDA
jgi:hypothetical protein